MEQPTVHLYALCWNEERMLPYFFRHYDSIVSQYFIFDNDSTDRSIELLKAHPKVSLRHFEVSNDSFVLSALTFYNNAWKESRGRADWVIVCNIDEHFDHGDLPVCLQRWAGENVTLVHATGYEMFSDFFPNVRERLVDTVLTGTRREILDKAMLFNPNAIDEIGYRPGRHSCDPEGVLKWSTEGRLHHFKYMGLDYLVERSLALGERLKPRDIEQDMGSHYRITAAEIESSFQRVRDAAVPLFF